MMPSPPPAPDLAAAVQPLLAPWRGRRLTVGLSGGVDSVVLFHLLVALRDQFALTLSAVHVHHGLNPQADEWAAHCAALGRAWSVPVRIGRVRVDPQGRGVEAAAREARYAAYADLDADVLALAHHQDDQIETFLLAALRGGGVRALAAMPEMRVLPRSRGGTLPLIRPLLGISRAQIETYAQTHGLAWVEDDSNGNPLFLRNWLRSELLPLLHERIPNAGAQLLATVAQLQEDAGVVDETAAADWQVVHPKKHFDLAAWRQFSPPRRRLLLHRFARIHALGTPSRHSIAAFEQTLSAAPLSAEWQLPQGRAYVYRSVLLPFADRIRGQMAWLDAAAPFSGSLKTQAERCGLIWRPSAHGLPEHLLAQESCVIRAARNGDRLRLSSGSKTVNRILQETSIPPFLRSLWPVVAAADGRCIAVAGIYAEHGGTAGGWLPQSELLQDYLCG